MIRTIAILLLLAATAADAQLTTTVKRIRLEYATEPELAASTLELGRVVVNEGNLADLRIGDGATPGGVRVGSDWWTNNMLSAWGGLSRVDVEALVALSIGNFQEKDAAALSAVAAVSGRVDTVEGWGDHAEAGYLTAETDPAWTAASGSVVYATTPGYTAAVEQAASAYGWGDHAEAGYLTAEADAAALGVIGSATNALLDLAGTRAMTGNLNMGRKSIANVSEFGLSGNRVTLHDDGSGGGKIGITRTAGGGTTERYIGYRRIDVGRFGTYTNVGDVVPSQEFAYLSDFTNYLDLAGTRAMTGNVVTLARDIKSRDAASVGEYGAAFGFGTTAGDNGAAFGDGTTAGEFGAAFGSGTTAGAAGAAFGYGTTADNNGAAFGDGTTAGFAGAAFGYGASAGNYGFAAGTGTSAGHAGFAAGSGTSAGDYGFAAGRAAKGADGSFVFADSSTVGTPFNRTNIPNSFSLRAAGGIYAEIGTNVFAVSNAVTMNGVELGAGGGSGISAAEAGQIATNVASGYLPLAGHNGPVVLGTSIRGFGATTNVGSYGFAAGYSTSAGEAGFAAGYGTSAGYAGFAAGEGTSAGYAGFAAGSGASAGEGGFAAGFDTSAGDYGFAAGAGSSASDYGFAAGSGTSAGDYGFAAGRAAKGADGSFVFADSSSGTTFNRTNRPNEFSARAAGGVYFDTPLMAVTGTVSAGSFALGDGNGQYFLNSSGTSWLTLDGTNLMFTATNGVTGRIQMIYE